MLQQRLHIVFEFCQQVMSEALHLLHEGYTLCLHVVLQQLLQQLGQEL